ncbi:MAG: PKD domain-containing protein [Candidatus Bipolaricaulota bacterium]
MFYTSSGSKYRSWQFQLSIGILIFVLAAFLFAPNLAYGTQNTDPKNLLGADWIATSDGNSAPAPLMLVPRPPKDSDFDVRVWTNKKTYVIGENARVYFQLNKAAYVYILDYTPNQGVKLIYPNKWEGNEKRSPGRHTLPSGGYNFGVSGPAGHEYLQALATTKKIDIYQFVKYPNDPFREGGFPSVPNPERLKEEIQSGLKAKFGIHIGGEDSGISFQLSPVEWDTDFYDFEVVSSQPTNQPPLARFSYSPTNPSVNERVRFDGSDSSDPDGSISRWEWDLDGDGNVEATGRTIYTRYRSAGRVRVRLTVRDNDGATSSTTQYIRVGPSNQGPNADFNYSPDSPSVGDSVRFDGSPSNDPDGSIVSWNWDFNNDGSTDRSGRVVWNRFSSSGTKRVSLTVRDNNGATSNITETIQVSPSGPLFNHEEADDMNSNGSREDQWYWLRNFGDYSRWSWYSLSDTPNRAYLNFNLLVTNQDRGSGYGATVEFKINDFNGNLIERGYVDLANTFRPQFSEDTNGIGYEAFGSYRISNPEELRNGFRVRVEWPPRDNRYYIGTRRGAVTLDYEY